MINANLKLNRQNNKIIIKMFCDLINDRIMQNLDSMSHDFVGMVVNNITNSDEYRSLVSNSPEDYEAEFGTTQIEETLKEAVRIISNQHEFVFRPFKPVTNTLWINGSFSFHMIEADFEDVVTVDGGAYKSNQYNIEWLRWIVLLGSYTIDSYFIDYDLSSDELKRSRSGKAVMKYGTGFHWLVPPPFQGDDGENNFITRAVDNMDAQFTNIFLKVLA